MVDWINPFIGSAKFFILTCPEHMGSLYCRIAKLDTWMPHMASSRIKFHSVGFTVKPSWAVQTTTPVVAKLSLYSLFCSKINTDFEVPEGLIKARRHTALEGSSCGVQDISPRFMLERSPGWAVQQDSMSWQWNARSHCQDLWGLSWLSIIGHLLLILGVWRLTDKVLNCDNAMISDNP